MEDMAASVGQLLGTRLLITLLHLHSLKLGVLRRLFRVLFRLLQRLFHRLFRLLRQLRHFLFDLFIKDFRIFVTGGTFFVPPVK